MALTAAEFKVLYPEFTPTPDSLVETKIAEAEFRVSDTWGARRDTILALETAANLADSPQARNARLEPGKRNVYAERLRLEQQAFAALKNRIG